MQIFRSVSSCICKIFEFMGKKTVASLQLFTSRGCLGCCTKSPNVTTDNKPTGGLGKSADTNKPSILEDFWSSSTYEMDNSAPQSQISASSTSNLAADAQCSSGSNPSEFVNRGLLLWNQSRQQWIGDKAPDRHKKAQESVIRRVFN